MSEWFYIRRWNVSNQNIWVVVDENMNLCTPSGEYYDRYQAMAIAENIQEQNLIRCKVIHNQSQEYDCALKNSEVKSENKRNKKSAGEY